MGRDVKRVPVDFDWELNKVWEGYLMPDRFSENDCPDCERGYSPQAEHMYAQWYGNAPFAPASTGSEPLKATTPAVLAFAERNVSRAPEFYGTSPFAVSREARRLADLWNRQWNHHLAQDDVDALIEAGRLHDFTHTWTRETGWQPKKPAVHPTAEQVNMWSLSGLGHDAINAGIVISARCEREGIVDRCPTCNGFGSLEAYEGQRAEADAWERTEPPAGEGWQLWETVTEGSPISPVFATAEELARWMASPAYTWGVTGKPSYETALNFVKAGWAPSLAGSSETGVVSGVEFIGSQDVEVTQ